MCPANSCSISLVITDMLRIVEKRDIVNPIGTNCNGKQQHKSHTDSSPVNRGFQLTVNGHVKRCDINNSRKINWSRKSNYSPNRLPCDSNLKPNGKWKECYMYLVIGTVSILCFVNCLNGDFVHDDIVAITRNPDVLGKTKLYQLFLNDFWGKPMKDPDSHKSYRPLTILTFRLNMLYSGKTFGFHLINTLLHTVVVLLVAFMARSILKFNAELTLLCSLLFATHPIHCEAVSSIVGRADVLCCIFYLVSFLAFAKSLQYSSVNKWMFVCLLICQISSILALLSKEQGITVLGACLIYYFIIRRKCLKMPFIDVYETPVGDSVGQCKVWLYCPLLSVVITLIIALSFRIHILGGTLPYFTEQDNPASFSKSTLTRFLTYSYISSFNARLLLSPIILSYDWQMGSIQLITSISDSRNISALLLACALAAILWNIYCRSTNYDQELSNRTVCIGVTMLVLPYIPASNLFVTVGFVVAERLLYIPSIGMIILVCCGLQRLTLCDSLFAKKLSRITRSALFALIVIFAAKTLRQNRSWMSREALFESGLKSVPQNAKTHYNYANLQKDLGNIELAMDHYRSALSLWPDHASAHNNLGTLLCEMSETDEAERHFKAALEINPFHPRAHFNLANIYSKQGLTAKAINLLKKSIELDAQFPEPYSALASIYAEIDRYHEAEKLHLKALEIDPDNADFCNNYGAFLQKIGRTHMAVKQYLKAIDIQPNHTIALVNALRTLRSMNHTKKAETLYKRALEVQEDPQILDNLGLLASLRQS